jgi:WbqC-like protein family
MRVAIMQPYFYPYAGYYRLFAAADIFVVYDCVQFPRRGWVHRNRLSNVNGEDQWLTLPLEKGDRDKTRICDLVFSENAGTIMEKQMRRFPCFVDLVKKEPELSTILSDFSITPVQYLVRGLEWSTERLGLKRPILISSSLNIPESIKAQERIIEIAKRINAKQYINSPGGLELYDEVTFEDAGLRLSFLPDYAGSYKSILQRFLNENSDAIAQEIRQNTPDDLGANL